MKIFLSVTAILFIVSSAFAGNPTYKTSTGNLCFKSREMMYPLEETFDGLKQTLMQSNLNIVTVTKNDGVLTAKGNQYNADEKTILGVTITVDFKERAKETTSVKVIASYETIAKKNDTGQIGGGGISLPIPVPFTGKYTLVGQGNIDDSAWYRGFFNSLDKILFENHMKYDIKKEVTAEVTGETTQKVEIPKVPIEPQMQDIKTTEPKAEASKTVETPAVQTTPATEIPTVPTVTPIN